MRPSVARVARRPAAHCFPSISASASSPGDHRARKGAPVCCHVFVTVWTVKAVDLRRDSGTAGPKAFVPLKLRRDSLRSALPLRAKTGGKGIRTPGLLIANETLYQLSYTPGEGAKISRHGDLSATERTPHAQKTAKERRSLLAGKDVEKAGLHL